MKKGVVLLGSLILGLALCVQAAAQPSTKAVETILIDNFDSEQEWTWTTKASRFVAKDYPIVKTFDGIPNSLIPYRKDGDPAPMVLGAKVKFDRKGDNWFELYPVKGEENYEPTFLGTVTQFDFWVWGANYNYRLEVLVRDSEGRVHVLKAGNLMFNGWKNVIIKVPGYISQHSRLRSGRKGLSFIGFRVRSDAAEAVDDFIIYFDQIKYVTNTLTNVYDGYALKDADFGDSGSGSSSGAVEE